MTIEPRDKPPTFFGEQLDDDNETSGAPLRIKVTKTSEPLAADGSQPRIQWTVYLQELPFLQVTELCAGVLLPVPVCDQHGITGGFYIPTVEGACVDAERYVRGLLEEMRKQVG